MRAVLAGAISSIINNIGLLASAEPDRDKREALVRELAEGAIAGIQDCRKRMSGMNYDGEDAELDAVTLILRSAYSSKNHNNQ